ncbi:E3 ubiquitin-protein ligase Siah2-like [Ochotona princeps]|uniref:E3 ubiquitin-protein ligase Siah2-like n=1 Tax=Ochotona princeps TaxID=9978 RepID=UPI002714C35E|nr:E3 ubiquitin-protein ligase Siah2-like [Ochotona princeps]
MWLRRRRCLGEESTGEALGGCVFAGAEWGQVFERTRGPLPAGPELHPPAGGGRGGEREAGRPGGRGRQGAGRAVRSARAGSAAATAAAAASHTPGAGARRGREAAGLLCPEPAQAGARTATPAPAVPSRSPGRGRRRLMDSGVGGRCCPEAGQS